PGPMGPGAECSENGDSSLTCHSELWPFLRRQLASSSEIPLQGACKTQNAGQTPYFLMGSYPGIFCFIYRKEKFEISHGYRSDIRFLLFSAPLVLSVLGTTRESSPFHPGTATLGCAIRDLDRAGPRSWEPRIQYCRVR